MQGFQLKDQKCGKLIDALVIALIIVLMSPSSYFGEILQNIYTIPLFVKYYCRKNFHADWKQVFVIQWVWWKDQKTLSDQDSLWQSFLSSAGRLVRVFSASQSRNLDDFYFLLRSCDGACPLHNTPVSMCAFPHCDFVCYFCAMLCACMYAYTALVSVCKCVYVYVCVCACGFLCVYGGSVSSSVCFQCFRDLPGSPLLCCWVPPLQTH